PAACVGGDGEERFDYAGDESGEGTDEVGEEQGDQGEDQGDGESTAGVGDGLVPPGGEATDGSDATDGDAGMDAGMDETEGSGACLEFSDNLAPVPPSVLFLLDRSGSMMETGFDADDPDKSRWQSLHEAVQEVVLAGDMDAYVEFGAKTFSSKGWGACGVSPTLDVPMDLDNGELLLQVIPGADTVVNGGTPTNLALETTMTYMESYETDSDKFVILITDGRIGCTNDDAQAIADAVAVIDEALTVHEITTYVVGIAPSVFGPNIDQLNAMAVAGGAPTGIPGQEYYLANDADMLAAALEQVVQDSYGKSCLLDLDPAPNFPDYTKVLIDNTYYELVQDCDVEDGFIYTNPEFTQIKLCGAACVSFSDTPVAEVKYYCDPG
ncbi:MAG: VWA domain-containing protein, partial [Myxococcales bacterium]|nr:VWA domain-containing protein [Myxococcales bacterium]